MPDAEIQHETPAPPTAAAPSAPHAEESAYDRIVRLAFGGDPARYDTFVDAVRAAVPPDVTVVLRGSAVTGERWADGQPFDADGPGTSDLDLTLVGGNMLKLFSEFHIPVIHSVPMGDDHPDAAPALAPLRRALCRLAGRPVNIQATSSLVQWTRDAALGQPYHTLIEGVEPEADTDGVEPAADASGEATEGRA